MNEELFRRIAAEYTEQNGAELRRELNENELPQTTPVLNRRVRGEINALRRRRYTGIAKLAAACLVLLLSIPSVLYFNQQSGLPTDSTPGSILSPTVPAYEILPLSFVMPEKFSVVSVEQDIEKTVYYLENSELDNTVMTLERTDSIALFAELTPISINGYTAYGSSNQGYRLLAFEKQGVLYVLTCEHDINTLIDLSKSILKTV